MLGMWSRARSGRQAEMTRGGAAAAPPRPADRSGGSEIDLEPLVHVRRHVAEARRLEDVELRLEQPRRVLVLVRPFEPDRDRDLGELLEVLVGQPVDLA